MAINDLTLPKTVGALGPVETQKLRHRLLALNYRYTSDNKNNIFVHIASESRRLYQNIQNNPKIETINLEKQLTQLHAKLGAGLNIVAQSYHDYDPYIQMDSLSCPEKTQQVTQSAFRVLRYDPRPLIQSWTSRINDQSPLYFDGIFEPSTHEANEFLNTINHYHVPQQFSTMGEGILGRMQNLQKRRIDQFDVNDDYWKIEKAGATILSSDNFEPMSTSIANTSWLDVVYNIISGIDFVNSIVTAIISDSIVDSILGFLVDFAIDFALDSCTFGLWTIGKFIINLFFGGIL